MRIINVHEAKTHLSRLLDDVRAGEEIILAKMGKPYARLVPIESPNEVPMGFLKGTVGDEFFAPLSEDQIEIWERELPL